MQEFFMDNGLWLLIALLAVIGVIVLLSGRGRTRKPDAKPAAAAATEPTAALVPAIVPPPPAPVLEAAAIVAERPVTMVEPTPASADVAGEGDDLLRLKGVGPKLKVLLIELGVTRFAQIAAWTDGDLAAIDTRLGNFKGRPVRDQWIDQARYLAAGDVAGFEAKYGKL